MKNKNKKQYITALAVLITTLMVASGFASSIEVNTVKTISGDRNNQIHTLNTDMEMKQRAGEYYKRDHESDAGWFDWNGEENGHTPPHGDSQHCDHYTIPDDSYICYKFELEEFEKTHDFGDVEIGVKFGAEVGGLNNGPDLEAYNPNTQKWEKEDDEKVKKSMGAPSPDKLEWKWYSKTENNNALKRYVSNDGIIKFRIWCTWGCHAYVSDVGIRWVIYNYCPTAFIDSIIPSSPTRNEDVTLSGHGEDPDGDEMDEYKWKDGSSEIGTTKTCTVRLSKGSHTISLKVKDDHGAWSSAATKTVFVGENEAPEMGSIGGPSSGKARTSITFIFKATDKNNDQVKFTIDWGDDETETTGWYTSSEEATVTHEYTLEGLYSIRAKATDKDYNAESGWKTKSFSAPKTKSVNPLILRLLEQFPLLSRLLELSGF